MAAIYFNPSAGSKTIFKSGLAINNSVRVPFLQNLIGESGQLIISDVMVQHHDNIQYFLTFDDFISYYYFGKGLGSLSIAGMVFSDCLGNFSGLNKLLNRIASIRGSRQKISFGNTVFIGVLNSFSIKASSEVNSLHAVDFSLQFDVIDNSMPPAVFKSSC